MKKFFTSALFIAVFAAYAVYQNTTNAANTNQTIPTTVATQTQPIADSSGADSASAPSGAGNTIAGIHITGEDDSEGEDGGRVTPTPAPAPAPNPAPTPTPTPAPKPKGQYADGSYTGSVADAYYGYIQVKAVISGGKITDVQFLQYPNDRSTSIMIN